MPSLIILQGPDATRRIDLGDRRLTVGRSPQCDVVLRDSEVSRRHLAIYPQEDAWYVDDLGSSNGTLVGGRPVEHQVLRDRDHIQVGRNVLTFLADPTGESGRAAAEMIDVQIVDASASRADESLFRQIYTPRAFDTGPSDGDSREIRDVFDRTIYEAIMRLPHTSDPAELVDQILAMVFDYTECDRGCILLSDPATQKLKPAGRRDRRSDSHDSSSAPPVLQISHTILDYVIRTGEAVLSSDAVADTRWDTSASISQAGIREAICVPMPGRYSLVGIIYIDTTASAGVAAHDEGLFKRHHLEVATAIGRVAALIVEDAYNYHAMLQSERLAAIGVVTAGISHHIKNILQGIEGGGYVVRHALAAGDLDAATSGWQIVEKNQAKIKSLVLDMLAYSKERSPRMQAIDLRTVVDDVVELVRPATGEQDVVFEFERPAEPVQVYGEADALYHALLNLVNNAVEACACRRRESDMEGYHPAVAISLHRRAEMIAVDIRDNGSGLSPEQIGQLFAPFQSTKGAKGTGLGLAVSRKIITEHGGQIRVRSEEGQGSTFSVVLPNEGGPAGADPPTRAI